MKKILFVLMLGLGACTTENKESKVATNTTTAIKNEGTADTIKKDTVEVEAVKEKSIEEKADDRLNKIMKNRKTIK